MIVYNQSYDVCMNDCMTGCDRSRTLVAGLGVSRGRHNVSPASCYYSKPVAARCILVDICRVVVGGVVAVVVVLIVVPALGVVVVVVLVESVVVGVTVVVVVVGVLVVLDVVVVLVVVGTVVVVVVVVVLVVVGGLVMRVVVVLVVVGSVAASLHEFSTRYCKTLLSCVKFDAKKKYLGVDAISLSSSSSTSCETPTV